MSCEGGCSSCGTGCGLSFEGTSVQEVPISEEHGFGFPIISPYTHVPSTDPLGEALQATSRTLESVVKHFHGQIYEKDRRIFQLEMEVERLKSSPRT